MSGRVFFVAGTDTDVGKTAVAAGLLRAAARAGRSTQALKPVAAGCERVDGHLVNDDALALIREATLSLAYEDVNPVALEPAIAPHIAAEREARELAVGPLLDHCRRFAARDVDWTIVEGAGGWLVPLNDSETLADFCEQLGAEVILVVGMRLGCLSHALLSVADIERRGLRLAGWVANTLDPDMPELAANRATLVRRIAAPCLGEVPRCDRGDVVETAADSLDLELLA